MREIKCNLWLFISQVNLKRIAGQQLLSLLSLHMRHRCELVLCLCCILRFCPTHPFLRARDGTYQFNHCEGSVTYAKVAMVTSCQSLALPIASFAVWLLPADLKKRLDRASIV